MIHALMDLQGKRTFFVRIINCQQGELKPGDKVKLAMFDVDPVPRRQGGKSWRSRGSSTHLNQSNSGLRNLASCHAYL